MLTSYTDIFHGQFVNTASVCVVSLTINVYNKCRLSLQVNRDLKVFQSSTKEVGRVFEKCDTSTVECVY